MKIESVSIANFRCFSNVQVPLDEYTCLVGPNGAGKSIVLAALNLFFRHSESSSVEIGDLYPEDFHARDTTRPVQITVTFTDLASAEQQEFADYYRMGSLVISTTARFDSATGRASVKQFGHRRGMPLFKAFFRASGDGERVSTLKELYELIRQELPGLPAPSTKDNMVQALRSYESDHDDECELIPSADEFYGFSRGANRLAKYIQWVFVPALKDAATEQVETRHTALAKLLERTVRSQIHFEEEITKLRQEAIDGYEALLRNSSGTLTSEVALWR